jgi:hypothetical protein
VSQFRIADQMLGAAAILVGKGRDIALKCYIRPDSSSITLLARAHNSSFDYIR